MLPYSLLSMEILTEFMKTLYCSLEVLGLTSRLPDVDPKDRPIKTNLSIRPACVKLSSNITFSKHLSFIYLFSFICLPFLFWAKNSLPLLLTFMVVFIFKVWSQRTHSFNLSKSNREVLAVACTWIRLRSRPGVLAPASTCPGLTGFSTGHFFPSLWRLAWPWWPDAQLLYISYCPSCRVSWV